MKFRARSLMIFLFVTVVSGLLWYYQYRFYRPSREERLAFVADNAKKTIEEQLVSAGVVKDGIPAINEPIFERVNAADQYLDNDGFGLVIDMKGRYRFYPFQILVWHEIINDVFQGQPLLIRYCPLCGGAVAFERTINRQEVLFGNSDSLYNNELLMYDEKTTSLWSVLLEKAVVGSMKETPLVRYPSFITSWDAFKKTYPKGEVLSRETGFDRDYTRDPYEGYTTNHTVWFPLSYEDERLSSKTVVFVVKKDGQTKAYPKQLIMSKKRIEDTIAGEKIVLEWDEEFQTVLNADQWFWFMWSAMYPETEVFSF